MSTQGDWNFKLKYVYIAVERVSTRRQNCLYRNMVLKLPAQADSNFESEIFFAVQRVTRGILKEKLLYRNTFVKLPAQADFELK